jgi:hypothetical protein
MPDIVDLRHRFLVGDTVDWAQLWHMGQIDDATLITKTGFRPQDLVTVCIPRAVAHGQAYPSESA